jgi:predicted nucleic acid-binding Zn ribbon protein
MREDAYLESRPRRRRRGGEATEPVAVGELLVPTLARLGLKTRARQLQLMSIWAGVVGDAVAAETRISALSRTGGLTVETSSPALSHQLQLQRELIRAGLNDKLGEVVVKQIRFRLLPEAQRLQKPPDRRP